MEEFLTDLSPQAMARAITENCYAFSPFSHGWEGSEVYDGDDVQWVITNVLFPPSNCAFHTDIKPENVDRVIEKFIARGKVRNVGLQWYIGPETRPQSITQNLIAHGFTTGGDGAGMAVDLLAMNENELLPAGLEIIEAKDNQTLETWCNVACTGFSVPPHAIPQVVQLFKNEVKTRQPEKFFLGVYNGKPVSTSMYYLGQGVVGLYFVATLAEARNKGIGFATTQAACKAGRALGYRVAILQASKMGQPVYTRMGFKEYCRVSSYQWLPESERAKEKEHK
jgi:GNAT superfamily N-acetyltransferase